MASTRKKNWVRSVFLSVFLPAFLFSPANAALPQDIPISIIGKSLEHVPELHILRAIGEVDIEYADQHISGDRATYNYKTHDGSVEGNVHYRDPENDIFSEKLVFNSESKSGTMYQAKGNLSKIYNFTSSRVDKIGTDRYVLRNGSLTTCNEDHPHWVFKSTHVRFQKEKYAHLKNFTFRVKNVPVFYTPYWLVPVKTKRATGFLVPGFGGGNRDGFTVKNAFFWAINDQADSTLYVDQLGKKGTREGLEVRYLLGPESGGNFYGEHLREIDSNKDLWKVNYDHQVLLPQGFRNVAHLDLVSEKSIDKEFGDRVSDRSKQYTDSYVTVYQNWETRSLYLTGRSQSSIDDNRDETFQRLPEVQFINSQEYLLNTPLMYGLDSSATAFKTEQLRNGRKEDFDVTRFNFSPGVLLPWSLAPWLSFTPSAGFHETYYSEDNAGGDGFGREFYNLQLRSEGPKVYKFFQTGGEESSAQYKHLITPEVTYDYVPDYGFDGEDRQRTPLFDNVDRRGNPQNGITYGIVNRVLKKEALGINDFDTREILRFGVSQTYDIREAQRDTAGGDDDQEPFSEIFFDLDTRFYQNVMVNIDSLYDVNETEVNTVNLELAYLFNDYTYISYDRRYSRGSPGNPRSIFSTGVVGVQPISWLRTEVGVIYNEMEEELTDGLFSVTFLSDCWTFTIDYYDRVFIPDDVQANQVDLFKDRETKVFFSLGLKGIGDFGRLKDRFLFRKL